jgi:hypothetical protein
MLHRRDGKQGVKYCFDTVEEALAAAHRDIREDLTQTTGYVCCYEATINAATQPRLGFLFEAESIQFPHCVYLFHAVHQSAEGDFRATGDFIEKAKTGPRRLPVVPRTGSIYDQRDRPAYELFRTDPTDAGNELILQWWTMFHDDLLTTLIKQYQWVWYWDTAAEIASITPKGVIEEWKRIDPRCQNRAWYNVLMYFAAARAEALGLTKNIRPPEWKVCAICENRFVEDSIPYPIVKRLGVERLIFCAPCFQAVVFSDGDPAASREQVLTYLKRIANLIGRNPSQDFGRDMKDFGDLNDVERIALFNLLKTKPALGRVKELFGSWKNALAASDIL